MSSTSQTRRELAWFVALVLVATFALHGGLLLVPGGFSLDPSSPALTLYLAGLAMPSAMAIALAARGKRRAFLAAVLAPRGALWVYACALLAQAVFVLAAWALAAWFEPGLEPRLAPGPGFALLAVGQLWVVLGEEIGWRGFALPRLESLVTPRQATLALATLWGVWHAPMFFVSGSLQAGTSPLLFAAGILAWSCVHTALYHRAAPSILPNLIFHGCANLTNNLGLTPPELDGCLIAAYLLGAAAIWATLPARTPARVRAEFDRSPR